LSVLHLFNKALLEDKRYEDYYINELLKFGVICNPYADFEVVLQYVREKQFNPNATFYKDIEDVTGKTRLELLIDQLLHYQSTYGTDFQGTPFIVNDTPVDISQTVMIGVISEKEVLERCRNMLYSGIALSQETIEKILCILGNDFEIDSIKNKEALCMICVSNEIYPSKAEDMVRVLVYKATGKTLLIKDRETLKKLSASNMIIPVELAETLSEVFYRFKDIFISCKNNPLNKRTVNKIRKLANKNHKPFKLAFWSDVLSVQKDISVIEKKVEEINNFKKISILNAILQTIFNESKIKPFVIRNGKLWIQTALENQQDATKASYLQKVFDIIYQSLIRSVEKNKCEITLPENLTLLAPTSEKNFMGEIPMYSYVELKNDAVIGIYWRSKDGANDLDLSMIDSNGYKIGWNSHFYNDKKTFVYSGDMTYADPEASELLYRKEESDAEGVVKVNPYNSQPNSKYKVFFAQEPISKLQKNYMVHPENIIYQYDDTISQEKILGVFADNKFIFCNFKLKNKRVSERSITDLQLQFLKSIHGHLLTLEQILRDAGFTITKSKDCVLSKDVVIRCLYSDIYAKD
jgi:hypothetical protein